MISSLSWHSSNKFDYAHLDSLKMLRHDNEQINLSLFIWLNRIFDKFGNSWTFVLKKNIRNEFAWIGLGWDSGRLARTNDRRSTVKPSPN